MLHVVLYQPEIPHNTGAVGRLCLATGARLHLIKPLGFSIDDRQLKRAGLDYWREVDVRVWESLEALRAEAGTEAAWFFSHDEGGRRSLGRGLSAGVLFGVRTGDARVAGVAAA